MKPVIQFLSDQEVHLLHDQALRILMEIGLRLPHQEALDLLAQNGAEIVDGHVVRFPQQLIGRALETVAKREDVIRYGAIRDMTSALNTTFRRSPA